MSDHEGLHEHREREADQLEQQNERLGQSVEDAKAANDKLDSDALIPTPADMDEDSGPEPETEYTDKQ
jgi:hypothetical protein